MDRAMTAQHLAQADEPKEKRCFPVLDRKLWLSRPKALVGRKKSANFGRGLFRFC